MYVLVKNTYATMNMEERDDSRNASGDPSCFPSSKGTDDNLSMVGIGSYFIDQIIFDIDSSVHSGKTLSTLGKNKDLFIEAIKVNNEKIFSGLVNVIALIGNTIGTNFVGDYGTGDVLNHVMKQAAPVYDEIVSQMLMRDEGCLFKIFMHVAPVIGKIFFGNDSISLKEWELIDGLLSIRKEILQDNVYFSEDNLLFSLCFCDGTVSAEKKSNSLSRQCDEIREKIKKSVIQNKNSRKILF